VSVQRVLVVENRTLLGAGVENLLSGQASMDVRGATPDDEKELIQAIVKFQPDVVVLVNDTASSPLCHLFDYLADYPQLRIVTVSLDGSPVQIYDRRQTSILHATDFVRAIQHNC
jgi:DNA-binding NarL/FixJ family response regulator